MTNIKIQNKKLIKNNSMFRNQKNQNLKNHFGGHRIGIFIAITTIVCLIIVYLNLISHEKTHVFYLDQVNETIINLKRDHLKDTINNIFLEIDSFREARDYDFENYIIARRNRLIEELDTDDETFITFYKFKFENDLNKEMWSSVLWNSETKDIYYDTYGINSTNIEKEIEVFKKDIINYVEIEKDNIKGIFGVSKSYIDKIAKEELCKLLSNRVFSNHTYIWVNEILDYEGGDNYAIRKIHPNHLVKETYLSTDMSDVKGNFYYLEELKEIKEYGEAFYTYYFQKNNSEEISEKLTYAKLYKDFNWIIAMGEPMDDIDAYATKIEENINELTFKIVISLLVYIFIVLLLGAILLYTFDKKYLLSSTESLEKEMNIDTLTKAQSRRFGEASLKNLYYQFQHTGDNIAVMMLDVDDFKLINDNYGHSAGDMVLCEIVKAIKGLIRSSDQIVRWGGDEFVGIFPGLEYEHLEEFSQKILDKITSSIVNVEDNCIKTTVSVGFSNFKITDNSYQDVLNRADIALYQAKETGKNKVSIVI